MLSTSRFHRILAAATMFMLAACDAIIPRPRESPGVPAEQPETPPEQRQPAPRPRPGVSEASARPALEQIRQSLRRLVVAEQGFFAENGVYTQDLSKLAFRPEGEAEIRFLWLDRDGWAVSGTHHKLPGHDCVLFVGLPGSRPTSLRYRRTGRAGVPVCDVPPRASASGATSSPPPASPADTASALDAVSPTVQMKVDLRNLVRAQDAYRSTVGIYSRRVETLPLQFVWQRGVKLSLVHADQRSWSARATHVLQPGKSCVIWFGPAPQRPTTIAQRRLPERSGVPACDD